MENTVLSPDLQKQKSTPALVVIFFTVFLYLVGFGVIIPILPIISREFGASSLQVGLLMSCYSLMQFLFSPFWGKLSDRYGRRPIIIFCLLAEVGCYLLFAYSTNLTMLFIARLLSGFFGASLSTASAYISDITTKEDRSKGMALIGVAFGLGFLLGPALGGSLSVVGKKIGMEFSLPSLVVAGLCFIAFVFAYFKLNESQKKNLTSSEHRQKRWALLEKYFKLQTVNALLIIFFLCSFAMSSMEATFILYMNDLFQWGAKEVSYGFAYIGLMMILTQGLIVRRMLPLFGEKKVLFTGLFSLSLGLFGIAFAPSLGLLALAVTFLAVGNGLISPSIMGSISVLSNENEQGESMGVTQSLSSLGRILGPAVGGFLYGQTRFLNMPFVFSGVLVCFGIVLFLNVRSRVPSFSKKEAL
ncbi:MAG: MFS transporter [Pseudobdellovibrionaceae bacterium]